jgi:uncharacterized membrane protein YhaH (DUF805 family)
LTSLDVPPIPGVAPPLGRAWYGIGPIGALKRAFQKYADFATDASRGEYWWFCLDNILITVLLLVASYMAGGKEAWLHYLLSYGTTMELFDGLPAVSDMGAGGIFYFLLWIWGIAVIVPGLALVWRRLHDSGRSGSWFFICFVPFVGNFILFILLLMPSTTITGYPLSPASARGKRY